MVAGRRGGRDGVQQSILNEHFGAAEMFDAESCFLFESGSALSLAGELLAAYEGRGELARMGQARAARSSGTSPSRRSAGGLGDALQAACPGRAAGVPHCLAACGAIRREKHPACKSPRRA